MAGTRRYRDDVVETGHDLRGVESQLGPVAEAEYPPLPRSPCAQRAIGEHRKAADAARNRADADVLKARDFDRLEPWIEDVATVAEWRFARREHSAVR